MNGKNRILGGLPNNIYSLEELCPICILTKETKIPRDTTNDVSEFSHWFMLQMYFIFFNIEIICEFTSTFVDICSDTSYPFVFSARSRVPHLDILKFLVNKLSNKDKKVAFVQVDEDGALERSSEFMNTCHNMNNIVKTIEGDASLLNGKIEIPNMTLYNITRALLLN